MTDHVYSEKKKKFKPSLEKDRSKDSLALKRTDSCKGKQKEKKKEAEVIDIDDECGSDDDMSRAKPKPKPKKKAKQQELGLNLELKAPKDTQAKGEEMMERCERYAIVATATGTRTDRPGT